MGEFVFSPNFLKGHELTISPHRYSHMFSRSNVQFNDFLNTIFFSPPTVALIVAVFLDNTLDYKDSARDRGMPWWVKFRTFKGDSRNEEFYTLPFNLNRFFPPSWIEGWNWGENKFCFPPTERLPTICGKHHFLVEKDSLNVEEGWKY